MPVDPAANSTENILIDSDQPAMPQADQRRDVDRDQASRSTNKESSRTKPKPTTPPRRPAPVAPPSREILPSPIQPPAEVDPPHRDPGDEVPQ
jgi:hypothetical protein